MNYYVFICLDGVPVFEIFVDKNYKAIEQFEKVDWNQTKYIILDFKSAYSKKLKVIEKGEITYRQKVLTKQILYFRIDILKSQKELKKNQVLKLENKNLMEFGIVLFLKSPSHFLKYIKKKKIMRKKEMENMEKAFVNQIKEQEILDTWKNIKKS